MAVWRYFYLTNHRHVYRPVHHKMLMCCCVIGFFIFFVAIPKKPERISKHECLETRSDLL